MKYIILIAALALSVATGVAQAEQVALGPFDTDLKLNELATLPQGLAVTHTPELVTDRVDGPTGVKWTHRTTVSSTVGPVTIIEFGCFHKERGQWTIATVNKTPYTASSFAKWYNCPNAELQPNQSYTDESNFSLNSSSPDRITRWYFIGIDANGARVKGEANVKMPDDSGC